MQKMNDKSGFLTTLTRMALWCLTRTLYRVTVRGRTNLPEKGGALLVSNHLSLADALFVLVSTKRHIRFIMHRDYYNKWWVKPIAKSLQVIPIASDLPPRELLASLKTATEYMQNGELVCIFAEGEISRTGQTLPFQKGMERIIKGVDAPIIPVHLDNVWGSIFSFKEGHFYGKKPRKLPYPVTVSFGEPMPASAKPHEVRTQVVGLGADAWEERKHHIPTVGAGFVKTARSKKRRFAFADSSGANMNFITALTKTLFLNRRLKKTWQGQQNVGILLPPSAGGVLTNLAGMLLGKTVVNLNYTLCEEGIHSCIEQCDIRNVVTSKKVMEKFSFDFGVPVVLLEDVAAEPKLSEKLTAAAMAWLCPQRLLLRWAADGTVPTLDGVATIIFSSGSTGEPKGVMLTHYNVVSNMQQLDQAYDFKKNDRFLGVLPFFHSLGFTATLVGPAICGVGAAYHPIPTDSRTVGKMVEKHKLTLLLATPTFLQLYLRGCEASQFGGLNLVVVGAEKMPERLATAFEEKFGILPMEAYGCTECSPGVAVNTKGIRLPGIHQSGNRPGTIGKPLAGVAVKFVHPETGERCDFGEPGLMWVKGPNIMKGYLNKPELTAEVLVDGWYNTGDIAAQDADGFITITDRLSRFSKIGGEMVPHIKVEEVLQEISTLTEKTFAVTGLPDEKKGERLVVLHTMEDAPLQTILAGLADSTIPNLWKPRADQFIKVDALPYLGSGKLDLKGIKVMASNAVNCRHT
jgi:acyl-[acyl-carrier-protein]-phospholipid O-acyltransferase/long-chain-fatty-acid--[acyl-carrier-protein] ligase